MQNEEVISPQMLRKDRWWIGWIGRFMKMVREIRIIKILCTI